MCNACWQCWLRTMNFNISRKVHTFHYKLCTIISCLFIFYFISVKYSLELMSWARGCLAIFPHDIKCVFYLEEFSIQWPFVVSHCLKIVISIIIFFIWDIISEILIPFFLSPASFSTNSITRATNRNGWYQHFTTIVLFFQAMWLWLFLQCHFYLID